MKDKCKDRLDAGGSDDERLRGRVLDVPLECTLRRTSTLDEIHSSSNLQKLLQQSGGQKAKQVEAPRRKISDVIFSSWFFRKPDKTPCYEEDECIVFTALPSSSTSSLATNNDTEPPAEPLTPSLTSLPVMSSEDLEEDISLGRERSRTISEGMPSRPPDEARSSKQLAKLSITSIVKSQFSGFNVRELNVLAPQST